MNTIEKPLSNVKLTFILGGPGSGKGTQCDKLVDEFGYKHLSTGDIMREEIKRATPEGEKIKKLVDGGQLVSDELTVSLLVKTIQTQKSPNYLIDGFPRSLAQALYFERNFAEIQNIIFYSVPDNVLLERLMARKRKDDTEDVIKERIKVFHDQSMPVLEYYEKLGKVKKISAEGDINPIYEETKKALLPSCYFILGPKCSGKTTLGMKLANIANMKYFNFKDWANDPKLAPIRNDDILLMKELIKCMQVEPKNKIIIDEFPESIGQAKYFMRNCVSPNVLFKITCKFEICQQRNSNLTLKSISDSSELYMQVKEFHLKNKKIFEFFEKHKLLYEVNGDLNEDEVIKQLIDFISPEIILIKDSSDLQEVKDSFIDDMVKNRQYIPLNIQALMKSETERMSFIGSHIIQNITLGKFITPDILVEIIQKVIFSGSPKSKYILLNFPETVEQAKIFETHCCKIKRFFAFYDLNEGQVIQDMKISEFTIETYFQIDRRLTICNEYSPENFEKYFGQDTNYMIVYGPQTSGKTTICKYISSSYDYSIIDFNVIAEILKKRLGTEDAPLENVTFEQLSDEVAKILKNIKKPNEKFVIDSLPSENLDEITKFFEKIGLPKSLLYINCPEEVVKKLVMLKNEATELTEDQSSEISKQYELHSNILQKLHEFEILDFKEVNASAIGMESLLRVVKLEMDPKIIMLKCEREEEIECACNNLSINNSDLLYICVPRIIKNEIDSETSLGQLLKFTSKIPKLDLNLPSSDISNYYSSYYVPKLVIQSINNYIKKVRQNQKYILLDGFISNNTEANIEYRNLDCLLDIQKSIGEILYFIRIQEGNDYEDCVDRTLYIKKEIPIPEIKKVAEKKEGEEGEVEPEEEKKEDEDEKPKFNPDLYAWSDLNGEPRSLGQVYCKLFKCNSINMKSFEVVEESTVQRVISKIVEDVLKNNISDKKGYIQILYLRDQ